MNLKTVKTDGQFSVSMYNVCALNRFLLYIYLFKPMLTTTICYVHVFIAVGDTSA